MTAIPEKINLIKSTFFGERETKKRLSDFILCSSRLSMGGKCAAFEAAFAGLQGRKYAVLFNSGSSANLALIQAVLNIGLVQRGEKSAFSALTWSTNVMPLIQLGLAPVPVDIEKDTLNVSSDTLTAALLDNPDIKMFFISNLLGFCHDIDVIHDICAEKGIILLEDNCESFGTVYKGTKLGNFGLASTFSMYVGHHLSTIEGGVVCTDDAELCDMLKIVRAHGWDRNLGEESRAALISRHAVDSFYDLYTFYDLGYNLRPTEITGFLGLEQVAVADKIISCREQNFLKFHKAARQNGELLSVTVDHLEKVSNFAYPLICRDGGTALKYRQRFVDARVEIRPIVGGNMAAQPFFRKYCSGEWALPNTDFVHHQGFYFPNNPDLDDSELARLVALLRG